MMQSTYSQEAAMAGNNHSQGGPEVYRRPDGSVIGLDLHLRGNHETPQATPTTTGESPDPDDDGFTVGGTYYPIRPAEAAHPTDAPATATPYRTTREGSSLETLAAAIATTTQIGVRALADLGTTGSPKIIGQQPGRQQPMIEPPYSVTTPPVAKREGPASPTANGAANPASEKNTAPAEAPPAPGNKNGRRRTRIIALSLLGLGLVTAVACVATGKVSLGDAKDAAAALVPGQGNESVEGSGNADDLFSDESPADTIELGPATSIPVTSIDAAYSGATVWDFTPEDTTPGFQAQDGSTDLISNVKIDVTADVIQTDDPATTALEVKDDTASDVTTATFNLGNVAVKVTVDPTSIEDELFGESSPVDFFNTVVSGLNSENPDEVEAMQKYLTDNGLVSSDGSPVTMLSMFNDNVDDAVYGANVRIIQDLVNGSGRQELYVAIQKALEANYGLNDPLIKAIFNQPPAPEEGAIAPQAEEYQNTFGPSSSVVQLGDQPEITFSFKPYAGSAEASSAPSPTTSPSPQSSPQPTSTQEAQA